MFVLKGILRAESQEKILIYLLLRKKGYSSQIASFFNCPNNPIQKQLTRLETDGVIAGLSIGNIRQYELNPNYPFLEPLKKLLKEAIEVYPEEFINKLLIHRTRPRKKEKPVVYHK